MNINLLPDDEDDERAAWERTMDMVYFGQQDAHVAQYFDDANLLDEYHHSLQMTCLSMVRTTQTLH